MLCCAAVSIRKWSVFLIRNLSGSLRLANSGVNLVRYWQRPRNDWSSFLFSGCFIVLIASTLPGSGFRPVVVYVSPKNDTSFFLYWILSKLNLRLHFSALWNKFVSALSWSEWSSLIANYHDVVCYAVYISYVSDAFI